MSDKKSRIGKRNIFTVYVSRVLVFLAIALVVSVAAIAAVMPTATEFVHKVEAQFPKTSRDIVLSESLVDCSDAVYGDKVAVLTSDDFALNCKVYTGTNRISIKNGAGWLKASVPFGEIGITSLHGYAQTYLAPLHNAEIGDIITVNTANSVFKYRIYDMKLLGNDETLEITTKDDILLLFAVESDFSEYSESELLVYAERMKG